MRTSEASLCVFVVDDDPAALNSLRFFLESEGYTVCTFRGGAEVLSTFPESKPACLIIDYQMPAMNGLELAQRLRDIAVPAPVILITGNPDPRIRTGAADANLILIEKPHNQDSLLSALRTALAGDPGPCATQ